jgi:hypothetical protein
VWCCAPQLALAVEVSSPSPSPRPWPSTQMKHQNRNLLQPVVGVASSLDGRGRACTTAWCAATSLRAASPRGCESCPALRWPRPMVRSAVSASPVAHRAPTQGDWGRASRRGPQPAARRRSRAGGLEEAGGALLAAAATGGMRG